MSTEFESRFVHTLVLIFLGAASTLTVSCQPSQVAVEPNEDGVQVASQISIERGEYLVQVTGCHDCHTPFVLGPNGPAPDMSQMLSGHPQDLVMPEPPELPEGPWAWIGGATNTVFSGPWGISYAINLTPHENTGIGIWTEQMFVDSIRTGRHMGHSRPVLPPMPWPAYKNMTDEDLLSIFTYLNSIPEIENRVPDAVPTAFAD